jgi:hypothetical protein
MYSWLAIEARTGTVIADLPDLDVDKVATQIGAYTTTRASLPVGTRRAPENWLRATLPGATFLVLVEDESDLPVWGGLVTRRTRASGGVVDLSLATAEAYFDRRYVGDENLVDWDQNAVVERLVRLYAGAGSNGGIPIRVEVVGGAGQRVSRTYEDADDKTLYSVLTELMGIEDGPEWTVEWERTGSRITPVLRVGSRLGSTPAEGLAPNATFELPGPVLSAELDEDYSGQGGANDVLATSSANGDVRPQSPHIVTADPDRPTFERRFSPSTSITEVARLTAHARRLALGIADGVRSFALTSVTKSAPRVGVEWNAGDEIGYVIGGLDRHGRELDPSFPGGLFGSARTVGWELSFATDKAPETITPVLQDPEEA